jgi:UDP-N-acetylglucosamine--N-acetylmuramyl-(pentapeptide) pyrophosphoryl-undecaprenol N-acetylglucosamine transferase
VSQVATVVSALGQLRRSGASALVALGGYGSVGPGFAAWLLGRPLVLLEQNSIPGKATRLLSLFADVVCTAWPETIGGLWRRSFAVTTGNPLRPEILGGDAGRAARAAGFEQGKPVLLVLGGSQGASAINRWVTDALTELARALPDLQVIHQTGERDYAWVAQAYGRTGLHARVTPFLTDIGDCYAFATVALARAGATTLSELAAAGVPVILVPYPYATDDHQRANARLVAERGGAVVVEEAEFVSTSLASLIGELLADEDRRRRMGDALRRMARPQATALVGRCVQALLLRPDARRAVGMAGNGR